MDIEITNEGPVFLANQPFLPCVGTLCKLQHHLLGTLERLASEKPTIAVLTKHHKCPIGIYTETGVQLRDVSLVPRYSFRNVSSGHLLQKAVLPPPLC
jgi:hypothetical protein